MTQNKHTSKKQLIELIKKELHRQCDEDRYGAPYVSDSFGDKEFTIDGDIDLDKLADVVMKNIFKDEIIKKADLLSKSVADFLDADTAWDNDEISEKDYCGIIDDLKEQMYSYRDKRQTVEIS